MLLLLTDIQWDTDGESIEDCGLPSNVIVFGLTVDSFLQDGELTDDASEAVSTGLSDAWGFCHQGFVDRILQINDGQGFYANRVGVMRVNQPL